MAGQRARGDQIAPNIPQCLWLIAARSASRRLMNGAPCNCDHAEASRGSLGVCLERSVWYPRILRTTGNWSNLGSERCLLERARPKTKRFVVHFFFDQERPLRSRNLSIWTIISQYSVVCLDCCSEPTLLLRLLPSIDRDRGKMPTIFNFNYARTGLCKLVIEIVPFRGGLWATTTDQVINDRQWDRSGRLRLQRNAPCSARGGSLGSGAGPAEHPPKQQPTRAVLLPVWPLSLLSGWLAICVNTHLPGGCALFSAAMWWWTPVLLCDYSKDLVRSIYHRDGGQRQGRRGNNKNHQLCGGVMSFWMWFYSQWKQFICGSLWPFSGH